MQLVKKPAIFKLWQSEFSGYNATHFKSDIMAGLTVAAVALPLALAFGVASGSTPAAGLVTAIISGFVIGALSGAPYQISGPTGAMSAVLILVAQRYGLQGLWMAGGMAGAMILVLGILRLGRVVNFIPAPVITGFTSGIAVIIFVGQIDNFLGVKTKGADTTTLKIIGYFTETIPSINWSSIACGLIVMAVMLALPKVKLTAKVPAALLGIALSSLVAWLLNWNVALIGKVPATIILDEHFTIDPNRFSQIGELLAPASAIAALGAIESLLAGVVAGRMTGKKLDANQELIAQGVGNMLLPFVGGVPATAAIARISVGVKAGGVTRMVSFIHSATLLASALLLGSLIGQIPLSALSGVLMVTAWRMNEWHLIKFYFKRRLKSPALVLLVTMISTVTFDLTQAILIGIVFSLLLFISQVASLDIVPTDVDWERLRAAGLKVSNELSGIRVVYISGTLFFGAASQFTERLENLSPSSALILSMRGVPVIDASGLHAIENIWHDQLKKGGLLFLTGLQPQVLRMMERAGLVDSIGSDKICWGADQAIIKATELLTEDPSCEWQPGRKVAEKEDETQDELPFGVVKLK